MERVNKHLKFLICGLILAFGVLLDFRLRAEDYEALLIKANAYFKAGDFDKAKALYNNLVQFEVADTVSLAAYVNLATIYAKEGNLKQAGVMYQNAVRISPENAQLHYNYGNVLFMRGDYKLAAKHYKKALSLGYKPEVPVYIALLQTYYALDDIQSCLGIIKKYDAKLAQNEAYLYLKALVYSVGDEKQKNQSKKIFEKILYSTSDSEMKKKVYLKFLDLLEQDNELDRAVALARQAIRDFPEVYKFHFRLALLYEKQELIYEAIKSLQMAYNLAPKDTQVLLALGRNCLKMPSLVPKGIWAFKKMIELEPNSQDAHFLLATAYHIRGDMENAIKEYNACIRIDPLSNFAKDAYLNLGNIYDDARDYEKAIMYYKEAYRLDPQNADLYYNLGLVYYHMKDYDNAIQFFKRAIELDPNKADYHTNLGNAYVRKNMLFEAEQEYRKAQDLAPSMEDLYNLQKLKSLQ